ncbi:MAG: hypothetical protein K2Y39_02560 [Candidatus Obscuribacterales bacterium]|nr:hypothetical protein [Candidatus Obscuribacterales bacterium]
MARPEVGSDDFERKGAKSNGSDNAALEGEKESSGNGLHKEFADTIMSQAIPSSGSNQERNTATGEASGNSNAEKAASEHKLNSPLSDGAGTGMRAEAKQESAGARANGSEKKSTEGLSGAGKVTPAGVGDAFPSSAQLLNQLKV